jgi:hypothetical protein
LEGVDDGAVFSERVATVSLLFEGFGARSTKLGRFGAPVNMILGHNGAGLAKSTILTR